MGVVHDGRPLHFQFTLYPAGSPNSTDTHEVTRLFTFGSNRFTVTSLVPIVGVLAGPLKLRIDVLDYQNGTTVATKTQTFSFPTASVMTVNWNTSEDSRRYKIRVKNLLSNIPWLMGAF